MVHIYTAPSFGEYQSICVQLFAEFNLHGVCIKGSDGYDTTFNISQYFILCLYSGYL